MRVHTKSEKGQAIVLIAFALVAVIGLIALAIDGGNAFADRRQAQNAADAAALAAASYYARDQTTTDAYLNMLVIERTSSNGYNNTAPRSSVAFSKTPASATDCKNASSNGYFFQVDIDSYNPTWFGGVVGVSQVHNRVSGKALGCVPFTDAAFDGNTIVVTHPTSCKALTINGSFIVTITSTTGNGIFVNSNCNQPPNNGALYFQNGSVTTPSVSVVGNIYGVNRFAVGTTINNPTTPIQKYPNWPDTNTICPASMPDVKFVTGSTTTLNPGRFPGSLHWSPLRFPPPGVTNLNPGTYCLDGADFKTTTSDNLTADGVTFVLVNATVDIPGGAIHLTSPGTGINKGLLFYSPQTNPFNFDLLHAVISINGNGNSYYEGSIVAPYGYVNLNGGGSTQTIFNCQVIAWTLNLGGTGLLNLNYDKSKQWEAPVPAAIELVH